jgi:aryl-alcohol dehydrogenase-like predicted oxidoreductase
MTKLGATDLDVFPLCLGGNVFGWTADEEASFAVLDAYAAAGGNFIDTADVYSAWVPGHSGGESETIIGRWMEERGNRDDMVIATKVGHDGSLAPAVIAAAAEASLERLRADRIDLYYMHRDDQGTPFEESLGAFGELVAAGKVRHVGASNFSAPRLAQALEVAQREGLPTIAALQNEHNLVNREYEGELEALVAQHGIAAVPYYGLAAGFLTGKYRVGGPEVDSPRAARAVDHLDEHGLAVLDALDAVAGAHETTQAAVALAWLLAQPTVVAPIASARSVEQLEELLPFTELELSEAELTALSAA